MAKIYLITEKTLKETTTLDANVDSKYINAAIINAQNIGLQPLLGTNLYDKLKACVESETIPASYKTLLDNYVTPYLANKVLADIIVPISIKIRNEGAVTTGSENSTVQSLSDIKYLEQFYQNKADFYANRMTDWLMANRANVPEFGLRRTSADMPSTVDGYNLGFYLGQEDHIHNCH